MFSRLEEELISTACRVLVDAAHSNSKEKGFWGNSVVNYEQACVNPLDDFDEEIRTHFLLSRLALISSEVSEAVEVVRKHADERMKTVVDSKTHKPEGLIPELCDVLIRVFDLMGVVEEMTGERLAVVLMDKMAYNATRPAMHGKLA